MTAYLLEFEFDKINIKFFLFLFRGGGGMVGFWQVWDTLHRDGKANWSSGYRDLSVQTYRQTSNTFYIYMRIK